VIDRSFFSPALSDGQHEDEYQTSRGNYNPRYLSGFAFYWFLGPEYHRNIRMI